MLGDFITTSYFEPFTYSFSVQIPINFELGIRKAPTVSRLTKTYHQVPFGKEGFGI